MDSLFYALITYFIAISLMSVIITITDKVAAVRNKKRISEKTLVILSILGGSFAMYLTMATIGHKTRHKKFMIGIPVILVIQVVACILAIYLVKQYG